MTRIPVAVLIISLCSMPLLTACPSSSRALQLIDQNKCLACHTLKGKGGSAAPNLTNVGSRRDRAYIYQQIKDPKSHNSRTDMPSFGDRLSDQDIGVLAEYLSRMK